MKNQSIVLSRLYIHPVKSMGNIRLSQSFVGETGLTFDRQFMITTEEGTFITARRYPQMVLFTPVMLSNGLYLRAPNGDSATVLYTDFLPQHSATEVWGNHFTALIAPEKINHWLSEFFDMPVQLRWLGDESTRRIKKHPDVAVSFADGYPYLLINEASFQAVQQRCPASIKLEQFRGNLIVTGADPFAEDSWKTVQIGDIVFDLDKPCSRCILTTVSVDKGIKNPAAEPLQTLHSFRTAPGSDDVDFGMNAIARNSGVIRVGDNVTILATTPPKQYIEIEREKEDPLNEQLTADLQQEMTVEVTFNNKTFSGNNQDVILEQLENHGITIPYSCRAGLCGCCKVTLISGEVSGLKASAIKANGEILACSCIPKSTITLSLK